MGTRIPIPPFSKPSIDELALRDVEPDEPEAPEQSTRRGSRRVPIRRRVRTSPVLPAFVVALLVGAIALAWLARRSG
jgi:hypothetical protein